MSVRCLGFSFTLFHSFLHFFDNKTTCICISRHSKLNPAQSANISKLHLGISFSLGPGPKNRKMLAVFGAHVEYQDHHGGREFQSFLQFFELFEDCMWREGVCWVITQVVARDTNFGALICDFAAR